MALIGLTQNETTGRYLMIFHYAQAGSLESNTVTDTKRTTSWPILLHSGLLLATRLSELHHAGFTHADLHPGNVVFYMRDDPALIDIGLSRTIEEVNDQDGVYGRLQYLPPEVFDGVPYTQASDIYCLGTLLWQLVIRVPPWMATAKEAIDSRADQLREELIPGAPAEFNSILKDCWKVDPKQRPTTQQVARRLRRLEISSRRHHALSDETLSFIAERASSNKNRYPRVALSNWLPRRPLQLCQPTLTTRTNSIRATRDARRRITQVYQRTNLQAVGGSVRQQEKPGGTT